MPQQEPLILDEILTVGQEQPEKGHYYLIRITRLI